MLNHPVSSLFPHMMFSETPVVLRSHRVNATKTVIAHLRPRRVWRSIAALVWLAVGLAACLAGSAHAQSTWISNSGTTWDTAGNWNNGVPLAAGRATFATASGTANPFIATSATAGALTFSSGTFTLSAAAGQSLTLTGTSEVFGATSTIVTSGTTTISAPLIFGGNGIQSMRANAGGPLTFSGSITKSDLADLRINGGGSQITVSGNMTVAGKVLSGANTVILSGSNTVGSWDLAGGGFTLNSDNAMGSSGAINFDGGTLLFNQTSVDLSSRFTVSTNQSYGVDVAAGRTVTFSSSLAGNGTGGFIRGGGAGTLILASSANSFAGPVTIRGPLSVAGIGNSGDNSPLGTTGTINLGLPGSAAPTSNLLIYTGNGETSNKVISLSANGGIGGTIQADNPSGVLRFSSNLGFSSTAAAPVAKTLTLSGSGAGEMQGTIGDNPALGGRTTSITKSGNSIWTLSGANSYSGNTSISGGVLSIAGTA